jgi:FtsH ternary system domain X3-analog
MGPPVTGGSGLRPQPPALGSCPFGAPEGTVAELIIRLRKDPETGKHDIIIDLKSDEDALPHEHEQMHREAVEKLIGKKNVGKVIIERESEKAPAAPQDSGEQQERQAQKQGG